MRSTLSTITGIGLVSLIFIYSCSEFIEKDLSDQKIYLNSPSDNLESSKYNQMFWWEPVDNSTTYRLQIASPSFDSIAEIVLDTLVKNTKFNVTLEPGVYEWRVRAENSTSSSFYSTRKLTIHQSSIAPQQVLVKSPLTGSVTNQKDVTYKWNSLFGTKVYHLQIDTNNFSNENVLVFNSVTPNTEFTIPLSVDRTYQWRVRAEADTVYSKWSPIQSFILDATPPEKVSLNTPSTSQVVNNPVTLQWGAVTGAVKYQLTLYKSDGVTVFSSTFPLILTATSYTFTEGNFNETVYWKVRAIDGAGNTGAFSDARNFTIQ